jgi:hypothetical protein
MSSHQPVEKLPAHLSDVGENGELADVIPLHGERSDDGYGLRPLIHGEVRVEGGATPVVYTLSVPETIAAETVALGINGFGAFKRTSRDFRNRLAENEGVPSLSYDPLRKSAPGSRLAHLLDPQLLHVNTLTAITQHLETRRDLPKQVRQLAHEAPYTLIPHSMGELPAVRWLEKDDNADKTAAIVHLGALGLGLLKPAELIRRTGNVLKNDIGPGIVAGDYGHSPIMAVRSARYFLSSPAQTMAEIVSCLYADTTHSIRTIEESHVAQSIVAMAHDDFFYPHEMRASLGDVISDILVIDGRHTAPQRQPAVVAQAVGAIIRRHLS